MILTSEQIIEKIKAPTNGAFLNKAVNHELKVQVHTEPVDSPEDYGNGHRDLLKWAETVIGNKPKYNRFLQFLKFPYFTNETTDSIFNQLSKVFESRNSFRKYEFNTATNEQEFTKYLGEIADPFFWKSDVWEAIKNNINSVIVVDMSTNEKKEVRPYTYVVKTPDIIDMENSVVKSVSVDKQIFKSFKVEYCIFKDGAKIIALDDGHYRSYDIVQEEGVNRITLDVENPHKLGYTPCAQIYSEPFNKHDNIRKKGPVSTTISDLDFLLYFETFKRYSDSFVPNPITVKYSEKCDYIADNGGACDGGRIASPHPINEGETSYFACPKCKSDSMVGPGEVYEVDPPRSKEEFDQIDAIHFIQPPLEGIEYTSKRVKSLQSEVIRKTVGLNEEEISNQAKNIPQIMTGFESRKIILRRIAVNLEIAMKFSHSTMAKLIYSDDFKGCSIFLGDEFFLETEKELQSKYKEEKGNGNSEYELSLSRDKITETKHKNNPSLLAKAKFLSFVEPYQGQTIEEVQKTKKDFSTLVSDTDFVIKINFDRFVKRFEIDEKPIGSLLSDEKMDLDKKITFVQTEFIKYANELITSPSSEGLK